MSSTLTIVAGSVAVAAHTGFFFLESVLFSHPRVSRGIFGIRTPEHVDAVKIWASNQGFYNLFLAAGSGYALWLLKNSARPEAGKLLLAANSFSMLGAAVVLIVTSGGRLWRGAILQGVPALLTLVGLFYHRK